MVVTMLKAIFEGTSEPALTARERVCVCVCVLIVIEVSIKKIM